MHGISSPYQVAQIDGHLVFLVNFFLLTLQTEDLTCETVTKESLSVTIKISVQYKIRSPQGPFYNFFLQYESYISEKVPVIPQEDGEFELHNLTVKTTGTPFYLN